MLSYIRSPRPYASETRPFNSIHSSDTAICHIFLAKYPNPDITADPLFGRLARRSDRRQPLRPEAHLHL